MGNEFRDYEDDKANNDYPKTEVKLDFTASLGQRNEAYEKSSTQLKSAYQVISAIIPKQLNPVIDVKKSDYQVKLITENGKIERLPIIEWFENKSKQEYAQLETLANDFYETLRKKLSNDAKINTLANKTDKLEKKEIKRLIRENKKHNKELKDQAKEFINTLRNDIKDVILDNNIDASIKLTNLIEYRKIETLIEHAANPSYQPKIARINKQAGNDLEKVKQSLVEFLSELKNKEPNDKSKGAKFFRSCAKLLEKELNKSIKEKKKAEKKDAVTSRTSSTHSQPGRASSIGMFAHRASTAPKPSNQYDNIPANPHSIDTADDASPKPEAQYQNLPPNPKIANAALPKPIVDKKEDDIYKEAEEERNKQKPTQGN